MSTAADEKYQKCKPRRWSAKYPTGLHSVTPPKLIHRTCHGMCFSTFSLVYSPILPWRILPVHFPFLPVFRSRLEVNSHIAHSLWLHCKHLAPEIHQIWTSLAKSALSVTSEHCMSPVYADDHMTDECWRTLLSSSGSTK